MLAITIVLFVVPHNQQIVTIRQFFTYRISLFRNQNLNIQESANIIRFHFFKRALSFNNCFKNFVPLLCIMLTPFYLMTPNLLSGHKLKTTTPSI